jgi:PAS domain S-box-containing protein
MSQAYPDSPAGLRLSAARHGSRLLDLASVLIQRRSWLSGTVWVVAALAVATLFRLTAGFFALGSPFVFYIPAVSIVALFAGWECGVLTAVLSLLLSWLLFVPPALTLHFPNGQQALTLLLWLFIAATQVVIAQFLRLALMRALYGETRYRRLLEVASGITWTRDEKNEIHEPQPAWTELTGTAWPAYSAHGWLNGVHPEDRPRLDLPMDAKVHGQGEAEVRLWNKSVGDWRWFLARWVAVPRLSGDGEEWLTSLHDVHEHKLASDRRDIVIGELRHRLKNLLTIIDALAKNSRSSVDDDETVRAYINRFLGRLRALGVAADLVLANQRVAIECGALVRVTLAPFMSDRSARFQFTGKELQLSEDTGGTLGLALHELATNALKYGALSAEQGTVSVRWSATPAENGQERIVIEWKEHGGPQPRPPNKEGFGMRLIRTVPSRERNGEVDIQFAADGFYCRIAFLRLVEGPQFAETTRNAAE